MDLRNLAFEPTINNILKRNKINNESEYDIATYYVEKCMEAFNLPETNSFRQKVTKILDIVQKFNVEQSTN